MSIAFLFPESRQCLPAKFAVATPMCCSTNELDSEDELWTEIKCKTRAHGLKTHYTPHCFLWAVMQSDHCSLLAMRGSAHKALSHFSIVLKRCLCVCVRVCTRVCEYIRVVRHQAITQLRLGLSMHCNQTLIPMRLPLDQEHLNIYV